MVANILIVIAILFAIPFVIALFVKKDYAADRTIIIDRPKHEVFDYIKYLKNQDNYSKWAMMDTDLKKEFRGTDGMEGFVYAWEGKKSGAGEQEIISVTEGERITTELRFIKPFPSVAHGYIATEAHTDHSTKVTWGLFGKNHYPRNIINLFIGGLMGKDLDVGLNNLKKLLEK